MQSDINDTLAELNKIGHLLKMPVIPMMKCPNCGAHGTDGFSFVFQINATCPVDWDGHNKTITIDYNEELHEGAVSGTERLSCNRCTHLFNVPEDWEQVSGPTRKSWQCRDCGSVQTTLVVPSDPICAACIAVPDAGGARSKRMPKRIAYNGRTEQQLPAPFPEEEI